MKLFKSGIEVRLTKDDITQLLEESLNQKLFNFHAGKQSILCLTFHPGNKYVARVTLAAEKVIEHDKQD